MTTVIYVDVLLFANTIINYIILAAAEKLFKLTTGTLRIVSASLTGSLFSLIILADIRSFTFSVLIKAISTLAVSAIAFRFESVKGFLKNTLMTFSVSVIFSGLMTAIYQLFRPPNMLIINDIVYFEFDPLVMLTVTALIYLIIFIIERLLRERLKSTVVKLSVSISGKDYDIVGKIDTGCSLTEPFSGAPVIIIDSGTYTTEITENSRVIPYTALSGSSVLFGNKADTVIIDGKKIHKDIFIASTKIDSSAYSAIINPEVLR